MRENVVPKFRSCKLGTSEQRPGPQAHFVQRAAHTVDEIAETMGMLDWVTAYRQRKWRFAGNLARCLDNRWTVQAVEWRPNQGLGRSPGHPKTRWCDQIEMFAGGDWLELALDAKQWAASEEVFARWDFATSSES